MKLAAFIGGAPLEWARPIERTVQMVFPFQHVGWCWSVDRWKVWERLREGHVTITARGHFYASWDGPDELHNDTVCRGCGHHGHFDHILDFVPCEVPATAKRVRRVFLSR